MDPYGFRIASRDEILGVRHAVLRPGKPLESAYFDCDVHPDTFHVAAESSEGIIIGCATFAKSIWENQYALQLRGMAVIPAFQGKGVGKLLLDFATQYIREHHIAALVWCNARASAFPFYTKNGWEFASDLFDIPGIGPHKKMILFL